LRIKPDSLGMIRDSFRELALGIIGVAAIRINERLLLIQQRFFQRCALLCNCKVIIANGIRAIRFEQKFICFANIDQIVQSHGSKRDHANERN